MPKKKQPRKKQDSAKSERDGIQHAIHGFPPAIENTAGVVIVGGNMPPRFDEETGVEIHEQRHG